LIEIDQRESLQYCTNWHLLQVYEEVRNDYYMLVNYAMFRFLAVST